jgi:tRNA-binding EMAP/Myf-like protein
MITFDDFKKIEIRAGRILSAEKIPDTDKLLKLSVDFAETEPVASVVPNTTSVTVGPSKPRQIVSGISAYFPDPAVLVGKTCMFITNLEPRMIRGFESNGMILAVSTPPDASGQSGFSLLEPNSSIPPGALAK